MKKKQENIPVGDILSPTERKVAPVQPDLP